MDSDGSARRLAARHLKVARPFAICRDAPRHRNRAAACAERTKELNDFVTVGVVRASCRENARALLRDDVLVRDSPSAAARRAAPACRRVPRRPNVPPSQETRSLLDLDLAELAENHSIVVVERAPRSAGDEVERKGGAQQWYKRGEAADAERTLEEDLPGHVDAGLERACSVRRAP
jgi:bacterioferritin-associated ferredoxin